MKIFIDRETIAGIEIYLRTKSLDFNTHCLKEMYEEYKEQKIARTVIKKQLEVENNSLREIGFLKRERMNKKGAG